MLQTKNLPVLTRSHCSTKACNVSLSLRAALSETAECGSASVHSFAIRLSRAMLYRQTIDMQSCAEHCQQLLLKLNCNGHCTACSSHSCHLHLAQLTNQRLSNKATRVTSIASKTWCEMHRLYMQHTAQFAANCAKLHTTYSNVQHQKQRGQTGTHHQLVAS